MSDDVVENPSAPPGKQHKYAQRERERRFLLAGVPAGEILCTATITDRYLVGTRLRLRRTVETRPDGTRATYYKLTQKVPAPDGGPGLITTVYLSADEHARLATIPAGVLEKTRASVPPFGVDVFAPPLAGLFLAEVEFDDDAAMAAFVPPAWSLAEVTRDARFAGGTLATTTAPELATLLATFGLAT